MPSFCDTIVPLSDYLIDAAFSVRLRQAVLT
jgi:hypothetical protein